jgi:hypothetical protein
MDLGLAKNPNAKSFNSWAFFIDRMKRINEEFYYNRWHKRILPSLRKHFKKPPDNRYHSLHLFFKHHRRKKE